MTTAATTGETSKEYLGMSDEDFLQINSPGAEAAGEPASEVEKTDEEKAAEAELTATAEAEAAAAKALADEEAARVAASSGSTEEVAAAEAKAIQDAKDQADAAAAKAEADKGKTPEQIAAEAETARVAAETAAAAQAEADKPVDYEKFFKQVMTPFKANGRTIDLKTPEEAIRLMQMGAGYGRKIQELQPHLKVLRMLEKNNLLDEGKLSLLIDVNAKNPEAIKKIIKDSGIDPLDLNIEDNVSYQPTNHAVTDKEMAFQEALSDIQSHANGQETLRTINQTWDQESKSLLWESPQLLGVIQSQRDNGIYDQIAAEIDRQKLLGQIPQSTPFLQAYKLAGDHLTATNGFKIPDGQVTQIQTQTGGTPPQQVIATRTAAPKAQVQNGDKAAAASPTKTATTRKATSTVNPLEMADDVFMKQFSGRL